MENRNRWIILVVSIAVFSLAATPSWAGSKQQHRWEGVAIGVGAAILGSALIYHRGIHVSAPATVVHYSGYRRGPHHRVGHHGPANQHRWNHRHHRTQHHWKGRSQHYKPHHPRHYMERRGHRNPGRNIRPHDNHGRRNHHEGPRHDRGGRKGHRS